MQFVCTLAPSHPILRFLLAAAVVVYAGSKLSKYGDVFSEKLRLGRALVGMVFIALATSLPELVTSVGAAVVEEQPNLALGDVLGSNLFNIAIFAALDICLSEGSIYTRARTGLITQAAASMLILAVYAAGMALEVVRPGAVPELPLMGLDSFLALATYLFCAWLIRRGEPAFQKDEEAQEASLGWAAVKYCLAGLAILWAGLNLARAGDDMALRYGLSHSFVGALFLAISTSLPEVAATIPMARRGRYDMAFGCIFGSNAFNVMVLVVTDVLYASPEGSSFRNLTANAMAQTPQGPAHLVTVLCILAVTSIVILGVCTSPKKRLLRLSWPSYLLVILYLLGVFVLYSVKG